MKWLFILLVVSAQVFATNYYFDPTNGLDANLGTAPSVPFRSSVGFKKIKLQPGDSVLFRRGSVTTDSLQITAVGTADKPVVVSAYGDRSLPRPRLSSRGRLVGVGRSSHLVIEQLTLSGAKGGCIELQDSSNRAIVIQDLEAFDCGGGIHMSGTDIVVRNNYIHDGHMVVNTKDIMDDDYGASGIGFGRLNGCQVYENRLVNLVAPSFDYGFDGGAFEFWKTTRNCEIFRNFAYNVNGVSEFGGQPNDSVVNVSIHHNVVLEGSILACFHFYTPGALFGIEFNNVTVDANTFVKRKEKPWGFFLAADGAPLDRPSRVQVRNNLFWSDSITSLSYQPEGRNPSFAHSYNRVWSPNGDVFKNGVLPGVGDVYGKPIFIDPNWNASPSTDTIASHYAPDPTSSVVGTGIDLGYKTDYFGNPVSRNGIVDVGAISLGSVLASRPSVSSPRSMVTHATMSASSVQVWLDLEKPTQMQIRLFDWNGRELENWSVTPDDGSSRLQLQRRNGGTGLGVLGVSADGASPTFIRLLSTGN